MRSIGYLLALLAVVTTACTPVTDQPGDTLGSPLATASGGSPEIASTVTAPLEPQATAPVSTTPASTPAGERAFVNRVIDGDTLDIEFAGQTQSERVRLLLVDTPETVDPNRPVGCFGNEASGYTKNLLPVGTVVFLERDVSERDRFDRLLRYVYLEDGRMVNEVLVTEGYAKVATYPPDVKHFERLLAAQRTAREGSRGLWGGCNTPTEATATTSPSAASAPTTSAAVATATAGAECDPSYPDVCVSGYPPDLDCGEISFLRRSSTGIRVPLITGLPSMISGSITMRFGMFLLTREPRPFR